MKALLSILGVCFFHAVSLEANPAPSEPQTRNWKEPHPQFSILHTDHYVDYKRDGKVVFRVIERKTTVKMKADDPDASVITRHIEFIFEDKVFASVFYDGEGHLHPDLSVGEGISFSGQVANLPKEPWKFAFWVCVPKFDYLEYVEIGEKGIVTPPVTEEQHAAMKTAFMKTAKKGYLWKFQGEKD